MIDKSDVRFTGYEIVLVEYNTEFLFAPQIIWTWTFITPFLNCIVQGVFLIGTPLKILSTKKARLG